MEEAFFIRDDLAQEREESIRALLNLLEEKAIPNEVFATKRFMISVMHAAKTLKEKKQIPMQQRQVPSMPRVIQKAEIAAMPVEEKLPKTEAIYEEKTEAVIPMPPEIPEEAGEEKLEVIEEQEIKSRQEYPVILSATQTLAKAVIDMDHGKLKYSIIEPQVDLKVLARTIDLFGRDLRKDANVLKDDRLLRKYIEKACKKNNVEFTENYFEFVKYYLYRDYLHLGRIDPLAMDVNINTIMCDGVNRPVSVMHGHQKMETNVIFSSNEEINSLLLRIAKIAGRTLDATNPILDVVIGNLKVEATLGLAEISSRFIIKKQ